MKIVALLSFVFILGCSKVKSPDLSSTGTQINFPKPSSTNCYFYPALEKELSCLGLNYLSGYGLKYCQRFQNRKKSWDRPLQDWVAKTTYCLQKALITDENYLRPCSKIASYAFSSHAECYSSSGFCRLNKREKLQAIETVSIIDIVETLKESLLQALEIKMDCHLGVSKGVRLALSYFRDLVKNSKKAHKDQAVALVRFVLSDHRKMDERVNEIVKEMMGFDGSHRQFEKSFFGTYSLNQLMIECDQDQYLKNELCLKLKAKYKSWDKLSIKSKRDIELAGLVRAHSKSIKAFRP